MTVNSEMIRTRSLSDLIIYVKNRRKRAAVTIERPVTHRRARVRRTPRGELRADHSMVCVGSTAARVSAPARRRRRHVSTSATPKAAVNGVAATTRLPGADWTADRPPSPCDDSRDSTDVRHASLDRSCPSSTRRALRADGIRWLSVAVLACDRQELRRTSFDRLEVTLRDSRRRRERTPDAERH